MRIKIACVGIQFSVTTVVTTVVATVVTIVVTTVVTENLMPTHEILFLMSDARCRAMFFFLNRVHFAHRDVYVSIKRDHIVYTSFCCTTVSRSERQKNLFSGFCHIQYECVPNYVITVFRRQSELTAHSSDKGNK